MTEMLDWAEKAGLENLRAHLLTTDNLAKEGSTTLTILLAGLGGSLTYAIKMFEGGGVSWAGVGAAALTAYLTALCGLLVWKCLTIHEIPSPTNEPRNLYQKEFELSAVREVELRNIQGRIDEAAGRNATTAIWLNRVRRLAVASPIVFISAAALWAVR